jgi:(5-formylfuran-3-yl)methyl phosphate synthase
VSELLVSVRSVAEAAAALAGGAGLIDVKEPERGPLGRAEDETIAAVVAFVAGRRPVSAALGELADGAGPPPGVGLAYAKWGLAGCGARPDWADTLEDARCGLERSGHGCRAVAAAYADWRRARAPAVDEVCAVACERRWAVLLMDTWDKDGSTLLDWMSVAELEQACRACRDAGVRVALAGSLGAAEIDLLRGLRPDWFAVRGAACRGGRRSDAIDPDAVRRLVQRL